MADPGHQTQSMDSVASLKGIKSFPSLFPALENVTFLV